MYEIAKHWTKGGTFSIVAKLLKGEMVCVICKDGIETGAVYFHASTAAQHLAEGRCDIEIGVEARDLKIPADYKSWNGFR